MDMNATRTGEVYGTKVKMVVTEVVNDQNIKYLNTDDDDEPGGSDSLRDNASSADTSGARVWCAPKLGSGAITLFLAIPLAAIRRYQEP